MPDRVQQFKRFLKRYEQQAKRQIDVLSDKAGPQVLQAVRRLRKTLNTQLARLERTLAAQARRKPAAKRRR